MESLSTIEIDSDNILLTIIFYEYFHFIYDFNFITI